MTRGTTFSASNAPTASHFVEIHPRGGTGLHAGGENIDYADLQARVAARNATLRDLPRDVPVLLRAGMTTRAVVDLLTVIGQPVVLLSASWTDEQIAQLERETVSMLRINDRSTAASPMTELAGVALCQPTSGSTSKPRLAARSDRALWSEIATLQTVLELTPRDRVLCSSAISHSYGLMATLASISCGADVWLGNDVETLRAARPTVIFGLGPYYERLLEHDLDLSAVRLAFSAGAPLPENLYDRFLDRFRIPLRQDYGTTETGTISLDLSATGSPEDVGTPMPHIDVRVSNGRVAVRGDAVALGYVTNGGLERTCGPDRWFETADSGWLDGGRLRLGPRVRDPILVGRTAVRADDLERQIEQIPEVHEVAVVPAAGSRLKIVVVGERVRGPVTAWCRENLPAPVYRATRVETRRSLPRSPAGKLLRNELLS